MVVLIDKIGHDLWDNKGRTVQVVLIIAMGAFAIGMIIGTRDLVVSGMRAIWQASSPATIHLATDPAINDTTLSALAHVAGVADAEGFMQTAIEWRRSSQEQWQGAVLTARVDYVHQRLAKVELVKGQWPQRANFAMGQGVDTVYGIQLDSAVMIRVDDHEQIVNVHGIVYDPNVQPPSFGGLVQFYASRDYFADLIGQSNYNRMLASVRHYEPAAAILMADEMQDILERQGIDSSGFAPPNGSRIVDPGKHFFQDTMDGIFFILGILAVFALILGLFLVYNTVTALVSQQVRQIGILKAIGARTGQIFAVYLIMVFAYGLLALLVALPLGLLGARFLGMFLLNAFNAEGSFTLSPLALWAQVAIALFSPLLACLMPILAGARITVREAISSYGLRAEATLLDRLLSHFQHLPELVSMTISNTFRHKQRVLLTQVTLVLSGLIFMTVMSARDSATYTYRDLLFSILRFDVNFRLAEPDRIRRVELMTLRYPGVKAVELWGLENASVRKMAQAESNDDPATAVFGVPLPTTLYSPQLRQGRWLQQGDIHAVVLNQELAADAGVQVGDWVTLDFGLNGKSDWQVVGLIFDPIITNSTHVPREVLLKELHKGNEASTIWIQTGSESSNHAANASRQVKIANELRDYYRENKIKLSAVSTFGQDTAVQIISNIMGQFNIILTLLAVMAVVIGAVGSIALGGVISLNVFERRREIGVLRAIGASSWAIAGIFVGEGVILGLLSWLIALPLSIPAGQVMVSGLSAALNGDLVYKYTPTGALVWLVVITTLSIAASWLPARAASRISVRESLAYE